MSMTLSGAPKRLAQHRRMVKERFKGLACCVQVAGDANTVGHVYPDQSLYPSNSVPVLVKRINQVCSSDN